jgi:hypothetical protein
MDIVPVDHQRLMEASAGENSHDPTLNPLNVHP